MNYLDFLDFFVKKKKQNEKEMIKFT